MAKTYLKAVCECKEWSETDLVVVEDVSSLMSFVYFMKRRWHLNQPGIGWMIADILLLFITGGFWFGVIVGVWLADTAYLVGGYLLCVECETHHLTRGAIRGPL